MSTRYSSYETLSLPRCRASTFHIRWNAALCLPCLSISESPSSSSTTCCVGPRLPRRTTPSILRLAPSPASLCCELLRCSGAAPFRRRARHRCTATLHPKVQCCLGATTPPSPPPPSQSLWLAKAACSSETKTCLPAHCPLPFGPSIMKKLMQISISTIYKQK